MNSKQLLGVLFGCSLLLSSLSLTAVAQVNPAKVPVPANRTNNSQSKTVVARIWQGKTPNAKAAEYYDYLLKAGITKIKSIPGNLGVQVFRRNVGEVTEFTVISYWRSRDAIRAFAGNDIEKVSPLPRDNEYLIEPEAKVKHFDVLLDERQNNL
ncbi:antibiotic biosynthesis monooxygenase [Nostoc sp. FACHB-152]|uniref:antibiotic biosynthesis monooxygenase family protein n=1 Tax=unclassified Nostoc TaxID=2593658 RepID=UPI001682CE46|nr:MULTISPECIES: antibiotic biosynthesis monooxygenase family protein [unclassified Nostoc]MBD2445608.1 antibiotic biosynthesis monooxygenase [Nostoc sp. FACHB-152]MBD2466721.1 antibiotic biosynthesis monooxygenase [Nostoc sp. FACHB-145]